MSCYVSYLGRLHCSGTRLRSEAGWLLRNAIGGLVPILFLLVI